MLPLTAQYSTVLKMFGNCTPFRLRLPLHHASRWLKDFEAVKIEFKPEVREKLLWRNAQKLLANTVVGKMHFSS